MLGALATILSILWSFYEKSQAAKATRAQPPAPPAALLLLVALCAVGLFLPGCATPQEPWSHTARKTVHSSVLTVNEFLKYELAHRAELDPSVTAVANDLRVQMPPLVREVREALGRYDAGQMDARPVIEAALELLGDCVRSAASALARAQGISATGVQGTRAKTFNQALRASVAFHFRSIHTAEPAVVTGGCQPRGKRMPWMAGQAGLRNACS